MILGAIDLSGITAEFALTATAIVAGMGLAITAAMSVKSLKIAALATLGFFQRMVGR
jgi:hypothetical protein